MLSDFGDQAVKVTLDHFRPLLEKHGVDVDRAEIEWPQLRHATSGGYSWKNLTPLIQMDSGAVFRLLNCPDMVEYRSAGSADYSTMIFSTILTTSYWGYCICGQDYYMQKLWACTVISQDDEKRQLREELAKLRSGQGNKADRASEVGIHQK